MLVNVIRPVPQVAIDFVAEHEGFRAEAYPDPATHGAPWTIGYGHTGGVVPGMTVTQDQARQMLHADLEHWARQFEATVGDDCISALTDNQYAASLSFCFNLGIKPKEKIWGMYRAKAFDQIPVKMQEYANAGGRKMAGLVRRRADEMVLWATDEPGSTPEAPPSSVTRAMDTPPVDPIVKPLAKSKSFLGSCVAAVCTVGATAGGTIKDGAEKASDIITPYVGKSDVLSAISSHLALVAAAAAVVVPFLLWLKDREAKTA